MLRYCIAVLASALWCGLSLAQGGSTPQESVVLDLQWLSTPDVTPIDGSAMARQIGGTIRMTGRSQSADRFLWPLRYPIPAASYSIMVVRYRAQALTNGPTYRDQIIQIALQHDKAEFAIRPVATFAEIVQDGSLQEFRKDLTDLVGDGSITGVGFAFHADTTAARLDISEIRFERGPRAPRAEQLFQQPLSFVVTDNSGRAVRDADVRAGLLERANWSSLTQTDRSGQAQLVVTLPPLQGVIAVDAEAAVTADGYLPRYVAPVDVPQVRPLDVRLIPPASARIQGNDPEAVGQVPDGTVFTPPSSTSIITTYDYRYYGVAITPYYVSRCAPAWWLPPRRRHPEGSSHPDWRRNRDADRAHESARDDARQRTSPPQVIPPAVIPAPIHPGDARPHSMRPTQQPPVVVPPAANLPRESRPIMPSPPNVIPSPPTPTPPPPQPVRDNTPRQPIPPPPQPVRDNTPKQPLPPPPAPIREPRRVEQTPPPPPQRPSNPPRNDVPHRDHEGGDHPKGPSAPPPTPPAPPGPPPGHGPDRDGPR